MQDLQKINFSNENDFKNFLNEHPEYILDANKHLSLQTHLHLNSDKDLEAIEKKIFFSENYPQLLIQIESLKNFMKKNLDDPIFKRITRTLTSMKNLWLICEKKGITFEKFINNQKEKFKQNGHPELTDDEIFAILNFDFMDFFEKYGEKNFFDFNKLDPNLKENAQIEIVINTFNSYSEPTNSFIPKDFFHKNPNLLPQIYISKTPFYQLTFPTGQNFSDINLINEFLINNYSDIINNDKKLSESFNNKNMDYQKKPGPTDFNHALESYISMDKLFPEKDENSLLNLLGTARRFFTNMMSTNSYFSSIPKLSAIFAIADPENYNILINFSDSYLQGTAQSLIDIVLKNPEYKDALIILLSAHSKNNLLVKLILENKNIKEKFPELEEEITKKKKESLLKNFPKENIPSDNVLIYLDKKNFTGKKLKIFKSLEGSFNLLTQAQLDILLINNQRYENVLKENNCDYDNIAEYIENINTAKTFDEFNEQVKTILKIDEKIFINLFAHRFDLCKPMLNYLISSQKINSATILLDTIVENLANLNQKQITELCNGNKKNFHYFLAKLNEFEPNKLSNLQKFEQVRIWNYSNKITEISSSDKNIEEKKSELKQFIDKIFDKELKNTESRKKANILLGKISNNLRNLSNENNADSINLAISYIEKKSIIENTVDNIFAIYKTSTSHDDTVKQLTALIELNSEFLDINDLKEIIKKLDTEVSKTPDEKYKYAKKITNNKIKKLTKEKKEKEPKKANIFNRLQSTKVKLTNEQSK